MASEQIPEYVPEHQVEKKSNEDSCFLIDDYLKKYCEENRKVFIDYKNHLESLIKISIKNGDKECTITEDMSSPRELFESDLQKKLGFFKWKAIETFLKEMKKKNFPISDKTEQFKDHNSDFGHFHTIIRRIVITLGKTKM